jgi:transposase
MQSTLVGIDVAARTLEVRLQRPNGEERAYELANEHKGHRELIKLLTRRRGRARVAFESTGVYHLDLALALHEAHGIEVMVVNPRAARDFARAAMQRSKTDSLDAAVLLDFVRRMPFKAWTPPSREAFELRMLARRISRRTKARAQEKNRFHATERAGSQVVCHDIKLEIRHTNRRIIALQSAALALIRKTPRLSKQFTHLTSLRGIGKASAILILAEICVLPKDMKPRQWVAHAGLDPRILQSGTSLNAQASISKMGNRNLRAALFMPALVAVRYEPSVKAFYDKLIAKQKLPLQALVAVMRKLLHSIHGMLRTGTDFDGMKFYAIPKSA